MTDKKKEASERMNALIQKHIPSAYDFVGVEPPNLEGMDELAMSDPQRMLAHVQGPSSEFYGALIKALDEKVVPWLARIHAKSEEKDRYPFKLTDTFIMAWLSHVFTGGVSLVWVKDARDTVQAVAVIHMEHSLFSGRDRIGVAGYVGNTEAYEEELLGAIMDIASAYKDLLNKQTFEVVLPAPAAVGTVSRTIVEV